MTVTPVIPPTIRSRLGWAVADAWVITGRDLAHWARQPGAVIANTLLFPIVIVLMVGYLLGGAMTVPGGGNRLAPSCRLACPGSATLGQALHTFSD